MNLLYRLRPFVYELAILIRKYKLQGFPDSIDIQFSSSSKEVGERLQNELGSVLDQGYFSIANSNDSYQTDNSSASALPRSYDIEDEDLIYPNSFQNSYGVVTDTVSFLPYVGIWDVEKYNGVNRVIGADGKYEEKIYLSF